MRPHGPRIHHALRSLARARWYEVAQKAKVANAAAATSSAGTSIDVAKAKVISSWGGAAPICSALEKNVRYIGKRGSYAAADWCASTAAQLANSNVRAKDFDSNVVP